MAMTAMTPACTGSETTRSAASRTLPTMFRAITLRPCRWSSRTARVISPPMRAPASTRISARGQARHGAHRVGQRLLPHQGNGIHRDALAADVVAIGLADGAHGHLADLGAAADDDDALAVDGQERGLQRDASHHRQRRELADQDTDVSPSVDLDGHGAAALVARQGLDARDVGPLAREHRRHARQDPWHVEALDQQRVWKLAHEALTGQGGRSYGVCTTNAARPDSATGCSPRIPTTAQK